MKNTSLSEFVLVLVLVLLLALALALALVLLLELVLDSTTPPTPTPTNLPHATQGHRALASAPLGSRPSSPESKPSMPPYLTPTENQWLSNCSLNVQLLEAAAS